MFPGKPPYWVPGINRGHPQAHDIALAYLFNEGAGTLTRDLGPHASHGTLTNFTPSSTEGWVGQGIRGNGNSSYIDIPQNPRGWGLNKPNLLAEEAEVTVFTRCIFSDTNQTIFEFSDDGAVNGGISFFSDTGPVLTLRIRREGTGTNDLDVSVALPIEGVFAVRLNTTTAPSERSIWHNGTKLATDAINLVNSDLINLRLLSLFGGFNEHSGDVDYIIMYNRALSDDEIVLYSADPLAPFRQPKREHLFEAGIPAVDGDPEGPLIGGKLVGGGILAGRLVG